MRNQSRLTPNWSFLCSTGFDERLQGHWNQMLWRAFAPFIPGGAKTLEIGCGTGKITAQAAKYRSSQAVGIDVLPQSIEYARSLADYLEVTADFFLGSGFLIPFSAESFDVVLSEGVIEHFSRAESDRMVAEHARVCRPGGHVIISVPNLLNLPLTYHKLRAGKHYHAYPERSYTIWGLARLLRRHGLRPIAYSGFAPTIGLEWFIHKRLRFRWFDRCAPNWLLALIGHEVLVAAEKEA
jgi:SAM-dependent methyltransferase